VKQWQKLTSQHRSTSATTVATVVDHTEKTKQMAITEADQLPLTTATSSSHYDLDQISSGWPTL